MRCDFAFSEHSASVCVASEKNKERKLARERIEHGLDEDLFSRVHTWASTIRLFVN